MDTQVINIPKQVDPKRFARREARLQGHVPQNQFKRFAAELLSAEAEVKVDLRFQFDAAYRCIIEGQLHTQAELTCQRSGQAFHFSIDLPIRWQVVYQEDAVADPGFEAVLVENDHLPLFDLPEDELLLALPPYPRQ